MREGTRTVDAMRVDQRSTVWTGLWPEMGAHRQQRRHRRPHTLLDHGWVEGPDELASDGGRRLLEEGLCAAHRDQQR